jgi:GNAT superfamily N-acetyltransferase
MGDVPRVRDATRADLPRLVALLQQMSLDEPREDIADPLPDRYYRAFAAVEADPRQRLLVVEVDGRLVGTATLVIVPNLSYGGRPHAIVDNVVVDETERGKGYGEALVRRCLEEAREAGCTRLALTTDMRRHDAHRFYERLGFRHSHRGYRFTF